MNPWTRTTTPRRAEWRRLRQWCWRSSHRHDWAPQQLLGLLPTGSGSAVVISTGAVPKRTVMGTGFQHTKDRPDASSLPQLARQNPPGDSYGGGGGAGANCWPPGTGYRPALCCRWGDPRPTATRTRELSRRALGGRGAGSWRCGGSWPVPSVHVTLAELGGRRDPFQIAQRGRPQARRCRHHRPRRRRGRSAGGVQRAGAGRRGAAASRQQHPWSWRKPSLRHPRPGRVGLPPVTGYCPGIAAGGSHGKTG